MQNVLDICLEYNMNLSIYQATRITHSSATLIDNMHINSQLLLYSYLLTADPSDHFPI